MTPKAKQTCKVMGILAIVFAALWFIPLIGRVFLFVALILAIIDIALKHKQNVCGRVGLGIAWLVLVTKLLFWWGIMNLWQKTFFEAFESIPEGIAEETLPQAVEYVEEYKIKFGTYPGDLNDLVQLSQEAYGATFDPVAMKGNIFDIIQEGKEMTGTVEELVGNFTKQYYYKNNGQTFYLFSKGVDGEAFTADDIFPLASEIEEATGYASP